MAGTKFEVAWKLFTNFPEFSTLETQDRVSVFRVSSNYQDRESNSISSLEQLYLGQQPRPSLESNNGMGPTLMCMLQSWKMRISGSMFVSSIWIWVWVCAELLPRFSHRITAQKEWAVRFGIGRIKLVVRIGPFSFNNCVKFVSNFLISLYVNKWSSW